jgi:hypothetical protein
MQIPASDLPGEPVLPARSAAILQCRERQSWRSFGLSNVTIPFYGATPVNIQAVEGCMSTYNQHHPRGSLHAPRYHVAGRVERWI